MHQKKTCTLIWVKKNILEKIVTYFFGVYIYINQRHTVSLFFYLKMKDVQKITRQKHNYL